MLNILARSSAGLSVSSIAATTGVSPSRTSVHLRQLNSRGVLSAVRSGRWVRYRLEPDASIPEAQDLVNGLKNAFKNSPEPVEQIFRATTAFTHPRRIAIVRALNAHGPMTFDEFAALTRFSSYALRRHLAKLEDRGIIFRAGPKWKLISIQEEPGKTLLDLARAA
jgi:DNA-binding transcriptional ArsR family regulator